MPRPSRERTARRAAATSKQIAPCVQFVFFMRCRAAIASRRVAVPRSFALFLFQFFSFLFFFFFFFLFLIHTGLRVSYYERE